MANEWRDWLTDAEAEQLRTLLPIYLATIPNERVRLARAQIDHAFHSYYLAQRVTSIVTAFESLLKVGERSATAQFRVRIQTMALALRMTIDDSDARAVYGDRSDIVHGAGPKWTELSDELISLYQRFEALLRAALLKASTDHAFASNFSSANSIRKAFGSPSSATLWPSRDALSD